jgi:hypothetical protein
MLYQRCRGAVPRNVLSTLNLLRCIHDLQHSSNTCQLQLITCIVTSSTGWPRLCTCPSCTVPRLSCTRLNTMSHVAGRRSSWIQKQPSRKPNQQHQGPSTSCCAKGWHKQWTQQASQLVPLTLSCEPWHAKRPRFVSSSRLSMDQTADKFESGPAACRAQGQKHRAHGLGDLRPRPPWLLSASRA